MRKFFTFLRAQLIRPTVSLAVTTLSIFPASAHQTTLDCDRAVANYRIIAEFDKRAIENGYLICGTPALMAKDQIRVACSKVNKVHIGQNTILGEQNPR